jgi:hypothetical protein
LFSVFLSHPKQSVKIALGLSPGLPGHIPRQNERSIMNVELLRPVLEGAFKLFRDRIQHHFREHQELNQFTALHVSREKYLSLVNINGIDRVEINVDVEKFSKDQTKEIRLEF